MSIDMNREAMQTMSNALGSLENRFREVYNKGYRDGLRDGANQVTAKIVSKILEEADDRKTENCSEKPNNCEDEPQTEEWYTWQDEQEYNDRWQTDPQTERNE